MLRTFFVYMSKATWAQKLIMRWGFAWKAASRFIAGETIDSAMDAVRKLNGDGINATLDHLGESTHTLEDAVRAKDEILELLDAINVAGVRANVSIKLTAIGLALDEALCSTNLEEILTRARKYNNFVRIDIEDTPYTDKTFDLYRSMRKKGFSNTGIAVQSYLYRSETDTRALLEEGACFRLIKGAYKEPPELAFPKKSDVDANFDLLAQIMMDFAVKHDPRLISDDGRIPPITALGTHDVRRLEFGKAYCEKIGLPKDALEFQMLFGIRRDLQAACREDGYPVRIYVPYGTSWYAYYMRRLAERPANVWFFLSNLFRR